MRNSQPHTRQSYTEDIDITQEKLVYSLALAYGTFTSRHKLRGVQQTVSDLHVFLVPSQDYNWQWLGDECCCFPHTGPVFVGCQVGSTQKGVECPCLERETLQKRVICRD